jgi:hypothetical protein
MYPVANFTNYSDWMIYAGAVTNGWFWPLILVAIWIVSFGTLAGFTTTSRAFAATSWLTGILGTFIYVMGGSGVEIALISVALAIAGFVMLLFTKEG